MDIFKDMQKTAEEGAKKWSNIEELAKELAKPYAEMTLTKDLLLALVDYMRPMAPSEDAFKSFNKQITGLLTKLGQ